MNRKAIFGLVGLLSLAGTLALTFGSSSQGGAAAPAPEAVSQDHRVFEMRTYTTAPGRLAVLNKRFREHTNYLFVKHGMHLIGYWTPVDKADTLVYILAYPSRDAAKASWKAFMADPDWQKAWADSKKDGPVVVKVESQFLKSTDYSPIR